MPGLFPLFFVTCLVSNPGHCERRVQYLDETADTPQKCLAVAQPVMAAWSTAHADRWRVARFRCGSPPRDDGSHI